MRTSLAIGVVLLVALETCRGNLLTKGQAERITREDVKRMLTDRSYVLKQIKCVLHDEDCDEIGIHLKRMIPEVLIKNCASCSPQEAQTARNIMNYIRSKYPNEWAEIQRRYSPQ